MDPKNTAETLNAVQPILFWLVAGLTGVCAIATVVTQNIVRAATWLLFTLAGTSAVFFLLGADLVGATQLLVYVGGTLVLVVFGVMLTAQGPFISMKATGAEWAISIAAGLLLLAVLITGIISEKDAHAPPVKSTAKDALGSTAVMFLTPDVRRLAPEHSRAEREAFAAVGPKSYKPTPPPTAPPPPGGKAGDKDAGKDKAKGTGAGDKVKGDKAGGAPGKGAKDAAGPGQGSDKDKNGLQPKGGDLEKKGPAELPDIMILEPSAEPPVDPATSPNSVILGQGFLGVGVGPAHRDRRGFLVRTSYLLPFEIVSVHLLVVLIGAAYLARAKRRRGAES